MAIVLTSMLWTKHEYALELRTVRILKYSLPYYVVFLSNA